MEKPFAITLDVGSSLANKTGSWRTERAVYVDRLPPCNHACPAGENIQQWLYDAEEGGDGYERAWRQIMEDNPFPAVMGRVCYHPCETACNRGQLDEAVGINSVERFLGDEAIKQRLDGRRRRAEPSGKRVLVVGAGPSGLSAAYHLRAARPRRHDPRRRPDGRRDDALRDPEVPPAARRPRRRDRSASSTSASTLELEHARSTTSLEAMQEGGFDAAFLAVGAHIGKRAYIPAGEAAHVLDAVSLLRSMEGEEQPLLGRRVVVYGGGNTAMDAARTAKRLGAEEAIVVYRRTRDRMPAHDFEVEEAEEEGVLMKWLSTIKHADDGQARASSGWSSTRPASRSRPASSRSSRPTRSCSRSARRPTSRCSTACPGSRSRTASSQVGPDMMTGHPGIFAGGDMVPAERTVTVARRPRQEGRPPHRRLAARRDVPSPPPKHELADLRHAQHLVLRGRAAHGAARSSSSRAGAVDVRRGRRRARRVDRAVRGAPLPVLRQLLLAATTATASAPTTR